MNIRTVEVRVARKLSRNYNSTEFVVGLVADLEPGEEAEVAEQELMARAMVMVRAEFVALKRQEPQEQPQQAPQALPANGNGKHPPGDLTGGVIGGKRAE